jgi:hypothetical protein
MEGFESTQLLSGAAFKELCKYNLDDRYQQIPFDDTLSEGDRVFMKVRDIPSFLQRPPAVKITAVVANNDETFDDALMNKLRPYVVDVYAVNSSAFGAKQIPMGFRDDQYTPHSVMVDIRNDASISGTKEILCLVNFILGTNNSERSNARDAFKDESWATISEEYMNYNKGRSLDHSDEETKRRRKDYYMMLKRTKFVVCPPGAGMDTHRVYETLYFGGIPIIKSSPLDSMYERLGGCWIVGDWSEATEEECNRRWASKADVVPMFDASKWLS